MEKYTLHASEALTYIIIPHNEGMGNKLYKIVQRYGFSIG
jgi:hypothetical protein